MKIYFAHPVSDYNTPKEEEDLQAIQKYFPDAEILNPNSPESEAAYKVQGMKYFEDLVKTCTGIVCVPFSDGEWGMGVWKEAESMARSGGPVWQLHQGKLQEVDFKDIRPLSINQTRARIKKVN